MKYLLLFLIYAIPFGVFADLKITEVMYDAEGTDTGFEWVEIYNNGTDSVDVSTWYFFENNVNHGLSPENFDVLGPGEYAIIVQDSLKVKGIFGNANFIKSSFSLSNEGETISLSDSNKEVKDSFSYASIDGAAGNGKSLQKIGSSIKESSPTFAKENSMSNTDSHSDNNEDSQNTNKDSSKKTQTVIKSNYYKGNLDLPDQVLAKNTFKLKAFIEHIKNDKTIQKKSGLYYLNFGDGSFLETTSRIETSHIYESPGTYEIVFEYYSSSLSEGLGEKPEILIKKEIEVLEPQIILTEITTTKGIVLFNEIKQSTDISGWMLKTDSYEYKFPKYSFISPEKSLFIPYSVHRLEDLNHDMWVRLLSNHGITISSITLNSKKLAAQRGLTRKINFSSNNSTTEKIDQENISSDTDISKEKTFQEYFQEQYPEKSLVDFGNPQYISSPEVSSNNSPWTQDALPEKIAIGSGVIATLLGLLRLKNNEKNQAKELNIQKKDDYDIHILE